MGKGFALVVTLFAMSVAGASDRVALLVSNSDYETLPQRSSEAATESTSSVRTFRKAASAEKTRCFVWTVHKLCDVYAPLLNRSVKASSHRDLWRT